jgi:hypothetical protein
MPSICVRRLRCGKPRLSKFARLDFVGTKVMAPPCQSKVWAGDLSSSSACWD